MIAAKAAPPPALDTLMLPFTDGSLDWPADGRVLFLCARDGAALQTMVRPGWVCVQGFRAEHDALPTVAERRTEAPEGVAFDCVLLLPPRQREASRAWLVRALERVAPGGVLVVSQANDEGARSLQDDLEQLCGKVLSASKHKCRVVWLRPDPATVDRALAQAWLAQDAVQSIEGGRYLSRPGLFSWDRIDTGSALLAAHLPGNLQGRVADLGAGYGYLSCELLQRCPKVDALDLYDADARALPLAQANVDRVLADRPKLVAVATHWHDVATGLPQRYHAIISNPPFHLDRGGLPQLGQAFLHAAANALLPDGRLLLVANRHLPYEQILEARFAESQVLAAANGFKVIQARGPKR
ncbi:MAG: class I SAM-dependent methyltransferase [Xanthomonadales bacterium]|jgi:16S rRNA (guanine1207-N2)-methyltransferase|nr:class I SAM-dependent methyltransferase [Xanthomonadales bacterium]